MVCLPSDIVTLNIGPAAIDKGLLYELLAATCQLGYYAATCFDLPITFKEIVMSAFSNLLGKKVMAVQLKAEL